MSEQPTPSDDATVPREHTATASTPPGADIRHTRPVDDPESLGASGFYAGSDAPEGEQGADDERQPPVRVVDDAT